jgi:ATP-dependent RNA helicase RhlE
MSNIEDVLHFHLKNIFSSYCVPILFRVSYDFSMLFSSLGLIPPLLKALEEEGYMTPTPIQAQSIPIVLQGTDLLGCAQTGTGKTAAFALPILQLLGANRVYDKKRNIRTLIVTPTRELAIQI